MSRIKVIRSVIIICFILFSQAGKVCAQCDPFFDPNCEDPDTNVPLDDYVPILLGAGAVLGAIALKKITPDTDLENNRLL